MRVRPWLALLLFLALSGCLGALEPGSVAPGDIPDPTTIARTGRPNDWLICPPGRCEAEASAPAEIYPVPPEELFGLWQAVLQEQPQVRLIATDPPRRLVMVQDRTPLFRFVDTAVIRVLPVGDGASSFAAYSRSEVGYSDTGTNRRRLGEWVGRLERRVAAR